MRILKKNSLHSSTFGLSNKLERLLWSIFYLLAFRFTPIFFFPYRNFLLRIFGANIGDDVKIYPNIKIWLPRNLTIQNGSSVGPNVNIYNQGKIFISSNVIVSQGAYICASTHNYQDPLHPLLLGPVTIKKDVWICTEAFIGPNVTIEEGCVIGARSVIAGQTKSWSVYAGNPAKLIKHRKLISHE